MFLYGIRKKNQGSKIALVRSYLRVPQAAGQVEILIFLVKIIFFLNMSIIFVMQGKCLFSDISRPENEPVYVRFWYLSHMREENAQTSLRMRRLIRGLHCTPTHRKDVSKRFSQNYGIESH